MSFSVRVLGNPITLSVVPNYKDTKRHLIYLWCQNIIFSWWKSSSYHNKRCCSDWIHAQLESNLRLLLTNYFESFEKGLWGGIKAFYQAIHYGSIHALPKIISWNQACWVYKVPDNLKHELCSLILASNFTKWHILHQHKLFADLLVCHHVIYRNYQTNHLFNIWLYQRMLDNQSSSNM